MWKLNIFNLLSYTSWKSYILAHNKTYSVQQHSFQIKTKSVKITTENGRILGISNYLMLIQ